MFFNIDVHLYLEVNIDIHLYDSLLQCIIRRDVSQLTEILSRAPIDQLTSIFQQKNDHGQCILHNAVNSQNVQIVKVFLKYIDHTDNNNLRWLRDKDEVCPLLLAMKSKMLDIFEAILSYPNHLTIPPEYPNLLKLAMSDQDHSMELLKIILDHSKGNPSLLYSDFSLHFPSVDIPKSLKLEHTIPIIVVGDADAGKSTFIKSLQVQGIKSQFYHLFVNVHNVGQHKAGVIPTQFDSTWFGKVVFYDLSAHREFVHEAILHCGFLADAVFVIVFDLHDETNDIIRKLIYWFNFIHYYHKKVSKQDFHLPNVIIVGSHLHSHRLGRITNWDNFYYRCYPKVLQKIPRDEFNIITKSLMDCRKSSGENARLRFAMLAEFERLRANRSQIPSKSYLLYSIVQKHCTRSSNPSMTFSDVLDLLRNTDNSLLCNVITPTAEEILHLCTPLKEYNLLLVLENKEELEQSWIVCDTAPLLMKVEEIIFNGDNHPDGGIMTRDTLQGLFEPHDSINPNMMISLMTHYCYCEKIHSIQSQSPTNSLNQERFFFPHLLPRELQIESCDELMFAWSVSPESQFHHLMPCFVHHFLLHLSQDPHIVGDAQRYNRSRHSIETSFASVGLSMVIHVDSNRDIVVSMKSESNNEDNLIKCLEKRNFLIRKIKEAITIIEPNTWSNLSLVETLISGHHPRRRVTYPILDQSYVKGGVDQRYKVIDLGLAVLQREHNVQPANAPEPLSTVNNLLLFEPYFFMSDEQRKILYDLETPNEIISYDFFEGLGHALKQENIFLLLAAVGIDPVDISAIKNSSNQHGYQPVLTKSFAHVQGKGVTYKQLRDMLDSISFFKLDDLLSLVPPPSPFFVTT